MPASSVAELTADLFRPYVEHRFTLELSPERHIDVKLLEVAGGTTRSGPRGRAPFSLFFLGPRDGRHEQGTYTLVHPELGRHELHVLALVPSPEGSLYQIVFG